MRGKGKWENLTKTIIRITPAYAGKSQFGRSIQFQSKDHPRLCGEKTLNRNGQTRNLGSPPPMRGKAQRPYKPHGARGITPAYAGKSSKKLDLSNRRQDHPRLCGEKDAGSVVDIVYQGSPPPMRGKVNFRSISNGTDGITPAYAGKRPFRGAILPACQDHPRLCGEKQACILCKYTNMGSPPPMRGKVFSCLSYL